MADYLEVVQFKERNGKWRATRLGYAKKNDKGALNVYLDALPILDHEGQVRMTIQKQQDRSEGQGASQPLSNGSNAAISGGEMDDSIPFAPETRG